MAVQRNFNLLCIYGFQLSSVGKMYLVCALLTNARACLYRNETSSFFGLAHLLLKNISHEMYPAKNTQENKHFMIRLLFFL